MAAGPLRSTATVRLLLGVTPSRGDLVFYPGDSHVGIVCGFDSSGNIMVIHCASSENNVVVTGKSGFTSIGRPEYFAD